jgi:hypothetical protein
VIDFRAFERMIDEIGGIDVLVYERVKISPIDGMSRWLEPKPYHLDGPDALAYARSRRSEGGDFSRAQRQQQVALAIIDRVIGFDYIPTLVRSAPTLFNELASGVRTNLALEQIIPLGLLALQIPTENIAQGVIAPPDMVTLETVLYAGEEAQVLKPVPDAIRRVRDQIFAQTSSIGPSISTDDPAQAAALEEAQLAVLNGAGQEGLAGRFSEALTGLSFNVVQVGNADRMDYPTTRVIDYTGNPYTTQYLVDLMGLSQSQILIQISSASEVDVAVVVGYDWQPIYAILTSE